MYLIFEKHLIEKFFVVFSSFPYLNRVIVHLCLFCIFISPDAVGSVDGLNLYVYVDNNPLKYLDLTGHGKEEAVEEGAVGGVNNVETEKPAPRKYRIDRVALSHDSSKEMRKIQQKIDSVFVALGFCLYPR
jgi:hypothetical protein